MMSLFNPELSKKQQKELHHRWEKSIKNAYSSTYKYGHDSINNPVYPQKKEEFDEDCIKFTVIGNRISKEFIFCYYLVKLLHKYRRKKFEAPLIQGVTSEEWPEAWNNLKRQFGGVAHCIGSQVAVLVNDKLIGGEKQLKKFVGSKYIYHLCIDYYKERIQQFANYIKSSGRPCAYMQLSINGEEIGTMIFMITDSLSLWVKYRDSLSEDYKRQVKRLFGILDEHLTDEIYNKYLVTIGEAVLALKGQSLQQYGLPQPQRSEGLHNNRDYLKETSYDVNSLAEVVSSSEGSNQ